MATNTLIMSYVLKKFKNARSSANNRWFAYVNRVGTQLHSGTDPIVHFLSDVTDDAKADTC